MKKLKRLFWRIIAFVIIMAVLVSPLSEHLPIIGDGLRVSAAATNPFPQWQTISGVTTVRCTWYAWQQAYDNTGIALPNFGNGGSWYSAASNAGYSVGTTPKANSLAVWTDGSYGHVAYVVSVNSSKNTMVVNEAGMTDSNGKAYNGDGIWNNHTRQSVVGKSDSWSSKVLKGFVYLDGSGSGSVSGTVTIKSYNDNNKNTITDTNAILYGQVNKPTSYPVTKVGIRIREDASTYDKGWSKYDSTSSTYTNSTYMYPYFDLNKELNLTLTPGTKYCFQFYAVVNSKEYWSDEGSFTTTGSAPTVTLKNSSANNKNTITDTNAILWGQVDKPKSYPVTKVGIRVRLDGSTYDKGWSRFDNTSSTYTNSTYMYPYFDLNKELNLTLTHNTTYYFQFYAVVNGKEYWSDEGKFTTTGSGHSYGSWTTTKEATCTATGTKTRTCSCGATETQTIAALGHNWSTTWSKDGSNHWHVCTRCNAIGDKAGHSWNSGTVTKQATCTAKGEKNYTCSVCSATKTESIAAPGHSWSTAWSKDGNNHWHVCSRCNSTGDKAAHSFTTKVVAPTSSSQGYTLYTCSVCSYSNKDNYTSSVTTCDHKNTKVVTTNATCGKDGKTETVCKDCGKTVSTTTIPATGKHTWDNDRETKKATCTASGTITYTCTVCGKTNTETVAATGHNFGAWTVTKEATYTQAGQRSRTCKLCGKTETETLPKLTQSIGSNGETITTATVPEPEIIDNGNDGSNNPPTNNNDYPGITVGSSVSDIINDDARNGNANTDNNAFNSEGSNSGGNASVTDDGFYVDENNNDGNECANIDSNGSDNSGSDPADTNSSDTNSDALIVDEATKIELSSVDGNIPNGSRLEVVLDSENRSDTYIVFDITLVDTNGNHIQPSGNVTVKIPIPADWSVNELYIYREESDGTYTGMNVTYDKDYAMFTTEHFSTYILTSEKHEASIKDDLFESFDIILDDSENNSNIFTFAIIALIILAVAALTVVVVFLLKKNR